MNVSQVAQAASPEMTSLKVFTPAGIVLFSSCYKISSRINVQFVWERQAHGQHFDWAWD